VSAHLIQSGGGMVVAACPCGWPGRLVASALAPGSLVNWACGVCLRRKKTARSFTGSYSTITSPPDRAALPPEVAAVVPAACPHPSHWGGDPGTCRGFWAFTHRVLGVGTAAYHFRCVACNATGHVLHDVAIPPAPVRLTPEQRAELVRAVTVGMEGGTLSRPLILDGLVADVKNVIGPAREMDFRNGARPDVVITPPPPDDEGDGDTPTLVPAG